MKEKLKIIVTGLIAQHPTLGGVTWDYLQYAIGLQKLGHDVYYFEDSGQWTYTLDGGPSGDEWIEYDPSKNVDYLSKIMSLYGLSDKWAYHFPVEPRWFGLSDVKRKQVIESADLLINVSGTLKYLDRYAKAKRLIYLDTDPVFTQIKLNLPDQYPDDRFGVDTHHKHFTFGESLSDPALQTGHEWIPTRQPIILSEWRQEMPRRNVYTTVMNWTSYEPLSFMDKTYGQKDVEFLRFLDLPNKVPSVNFEVAFNKIRREHHEEWESKENILPDEPHQSKNNAAKLSPGEFLSCKNWQIVDPAEICYDLASYRHYIESSKAEWSIAKNGYVAGQSGWFSCRSACYLAAGRPVVVQDTGFSHVLPVGEGLLSFTNLDEAAAAVDKVESNYEKHAKAARALAEEYFDSDKVLSRFIDECIN